MEKYIINGGNRLEGEVAVTGAKNAVLGIIPACLLGDSPSVLENVPDIDDVHEYIDILRELGAEVTFEGDKLTIDPRGVDIYDCSKFPELVSEMRASYYLFGSLLSRFGKAIVPLPGGCDIGLRPTDLHEFALKKLGAKIRKDQLNIYLEADELVGANIFLHKVSVGATINILLAACLAKGTTVLENAALEPHIVDVANFLNHMGADIRGAGTDRIVIRGVEKLHGCEYTVVPDQITTGTYMIAAAATGGDVTIRNAIPIHMLELSRSMEKMGIHVEKVENGLRVRSDGNFRPTDIRTLPYPGFPTDLQQPFTVLLMLANGDSRVEETIFEDRMKYIRQLRKMGAKANVEKKRICHVYGGYPLYGARVKATDLRAGAALVIAGLVAEGQTEITNLHYIDRGYEDLEENLKKLGADITRVES